MTRGLSFRALVGELLNSPEYRGGVDPSVASIPDPVAAETTIKPADIIARHSVEELIAAADEYYRGIADPTALMSGRLPTCTGAGHAANLGALL
jgi:hypothetical protein